MKFSAVVALAASCVSAASLKASSTAVAAFSNDHSSDSFVRPLEFKHRLRVCNAYPYSAALDVYRGKSEKLTADNSLAYKQCRDFKVQLTPGDKLEFKVGDANAGTFSVSELPNNDAVLFLAIYRHDTLSTAVSFESHVFANLLNAQIAVIDTYKGAKASQLRIQDHDGTTASARSEELRYDSVVAVNPGKYEAVLQDAAGKVEAMQQLVTLNRESYVVLRVGVEAKDGQSFPQELIVFPQSDASSLDGGASASWSIWKPSTWFN
jgi:hypothetical protein